MYIKNFEQSDIKSNNLIVSREKIFFFMKITSYENYAPYDIAPQGHRVYG